MVSVRLAHRLVREMHRLVRLLHRFRCIRCTGARGALVRLLHRFAVFGWLNYVGRMAAVRTISH